MKKSILIILLFLYTLIPASAENYEVLPIKKIEANPINVAVMLTEQANSAGIASTCEYYGYLRQASQDGYFVYKHPNGSTIRFTANSEGDGKFFPIVEVKSSVSQKQKEEILKNLKFKKNENFYKRNSIDHQTRCSAASQGFLRLSTHPKEKK